MSIKIQIRNKTQLISDGCQTTHNMSKSFIPNTNQNTVVHHNKRAKSNIFRNMFSTVYIEPVERKYEVEFASYQAHTTKPMQISFPHISAMPKSKYTFHDKYEKSVKLPKNSLHMRSKINLFLLRFAKYKNKPHLASLLADSLKRSIESEGMVSSTIYFPKLVNRLGKTIVQASKKMNATKVVTCISSS
jgi:hypothetical protein